MQSIPGPFKKTYRVTLTLQGAPVWPSPLLWGDTQMDARWVAADLYRRGLGLPDDIFAELPGFDDFTVEVMREPDIG
jgi:hypothetical protein